MNEDLQQTGFVNKQVRKLRKGRWQLEARLQQQ